MGASARGADAGAAAADHDGSDGDGDGRADGVEASLGTAVEGWLLGGATASCCSGGDGGAACCGGPCWSCGRGSGSALCWKPTFHSLPGGGASPPDSCTRPDNSSLVAPSLLRVWIRTSSPSTWNSSEPSGMP